VEMDKIDKYLLFNTLDGIIQYEDMSEDPKEILDNVMYDLRKIRKMVE